MTAKSEPAVENPVLSLLNSRRDRGTFPGSHGDGARIGLVIEGGGMRGIISCAAVDALDQLGFGNCFDAVLGTSAGAINGAYFLSGQISLGTSIYYDDLSGDRFIRIPRWPDFMDLDYLFDDWIVGEKALDVAKVLASPADLWITATDAETGRAAYFSNRDLDDDELIRALRASSSTPMFTSNVETIRGRRYNDGLVHAAIPVDKARALGCTHLVCVLTRPAGYRKASRASVAWIERLRLAALSLPGEFRRAFVNRVAAYNRSLAHVEENPDTVLTLRPRAADPMIGNAERERDNLVRAAVESMRRTATQLGRPDAPLRLLDGTMVP